MSNPMNHSRAGALGLLLARVPLGVYFVFAGYGKLVGPGLTKFVQGSIGASGPFMPETLGRAYLHTLPFVEIVVGAMIVVGLLTRAAGLLAVLMLVSFMMAVTGVGLKLDGSGPPFHSNVIFAGLSLLLMLNGAGVFSIDGRLGRTRLSEGAR